MTFLFVRIMIKRILFLQLLWIFASFTVPKRATKWIITQNSSLTIYGSTNINKFSCAIVSYPKTDTITLDKVNDLILLTGSLSLSTKSFECDNVLMTHQFRKTLKMEEFPLLYIKFLSLKELPTKNQKIKQIKGLVAIKIAEITKYYEICYEMEFLTDSIVLRGDQAVQFSDFKLVAPQRVGKLIKVKNGLNILFELKLKEAI